jgi:hypothetical protein
LKIETGIRIPEFYGFEMTKFVFTPPHCYAQLEGGFSQLTLWSLFSFLQPLIPEERKGKTDKDKFKSAI